MFLRKKLRCSNLLEKSTFNDLLNSKFVYPEFKKLNISNIVFVESSLVKNFKNPFEQNHSNILEKKNYVIEESDTVVVYKATDNMGSIYMIIVVNPVELWHSSFVDKLYLV